MCFDVGHLLVSNNTAPTYIWLHWFISFFQIIIGISVSISVLCSMYVSEFVPSYSELMLGGVGKHFPKWDQTKPNGTPNTCQCPTTRHLNIWVHWFISFSQIIISVGVSISVLCLCSCLIFGAHVGWGGGDIFLNEIKPNLMVPLLHRILSYVHSTGKRMFKAAKFSKSMIGRCWIRLTMRSFNRSHDSTDS